MMPRLLRIFRFYFTYHQNRTALYPELALSLYICTMRKNFKFILPVIKRSVTIFLLVLSSLCVKAQLPSDLSGIKSSQISDVQLVQFIRQAESSGMSETEVLQEFRRRGMPELEIEVLTARIKALMPAAGVTQPQTPAAATAAGQYKRTYKGDLLQVADTVVKAKVFGAELFTGGNPLFIPNIKVPTPLKYIIGPEDELQLDIYGNNVSSQKLIVTPEGKVNIKYAGLISVSGLSIEQASAVMRARLLKYYPSLASGETKIALTLSSLRSMQVMVVGAVKKPGTITLPSVATLFNALYASGGPVDNGSFRRIQLIRDNKVIAEADLYDFILKGDSKANLFLRDNDLILVPYAQRQVKLEGALNRTGIFEIKDTETLSDLLQFAGGFQSDAFRGRITGTRIADIEKRMIDVAAAGYDAFKLIHGDSLFVSKVIERFENRVQITGAVFKPGAYALENGMQIKDLIEKAQGLKQDAFRGRVNMVRMRDDRSREYLSFSLHDIMAGKQQIALQKEDSLHVSSAISLLDTTTVNITGAIRNPGIYRYDDALTLQALVLQAGGYREDALPSVIEIGRRNLGVDPSQKGSATSEIIKITLDKDLGFRGGDVLLQPYDIITVKTDPSKLNQLNISIRGEVKFTGNYTLASPEETLSSVIIRAGGLLPYADMDGARLIRQQQRTADTAELKRLFSTIKSPSQKDSADFGILSLQKNTTEVALDLRGALNNPGGSQDLVLQDGDELIVPRKLNTVNIEGAVLNPVAVQYQNGSLRKYISAAGGFSKNASKSKVFVIYPNGGAAQTRQFLGIRNYPNVTPGSRIFIPEKAAARGFDPAKAGVLVSAFSAIITAIILLAR